jgi:CubicO group peptidase (beta-lactamase class C family)
VRGGIVSKSWNRPQTWLLLIVLAVGSLITFLAGLHLYVTATAVTLHPSAPEVPSVGRAAPPPPWTGAVEQARAAVRTVLSERNLPGLSVAVGAGGSLVWAEGFGWADIDARVPVDPGTRFRVGTASIPLTSAAAGLLVEAGALKLDEPIQAAVPEFPKKDWPVTLRQVMAHTAGLTSDGGDEGPLFSRHCERPIEAFPAFADSALRFQPGTDYRFSRYGWIVVSAAIEAAAGEPFLTVMQKRVFEPLGMHATGMDADATSERPTDAGRDWATPYFPRYAADPRYGPDPMRDIDLSCYAGGGAFVSTPSDLVRFGLAIQGGTLLKPATVDLFQTSQRLPSGRETGYGLGWDLETVDIGGTPTRVVGHDGDVLGGPLASLMIVRDRGLVIAVVSNTSYADPEAIAVKIAQAFARQPAPAPPR